MHVAHPGGSELSTHTHTHTQGQGPASPAAADQKGLAVAALILEALPPAAAIRLVYDMYDAQLALLPVYLRSQVR